MGLSRITQSKAQHHEDHASSSPQLHPRGGAEGGNVHTCLPRRPMRAPRSPHAPARPAAQNSRGELSHAGVTCHNRRRGGGAAPACNPKGRPRAPAAEGRLAISRRFVRGGCLVRSQSAGGVFFAACCSCPSPSGGDPSISLTASQPPNHRLASSPLVFLPRRLRSPSSLTPCPTAASQSSHQSAGAFFAATPSESAPVAHGHKG